MVASKRRNLYCTRVKDENKIPMNKGVQRKNYCRKQKRDKFLLQWNLYMGIQEATDCLQSTKPDLINIG